MNNRQSGFKLMTRLIKVLKPLTPIMMIYRTIFWSLYSIYYTCNS